MSPTKTTTYSWDLGEYVNAVPLYQQEVDNSQVYTVDKIEKLDFVDVSNKERFLPGYVSQEGSYILASGEEYNGIVAVDVKSGRYDSHYLMGNYYQYNTATAGSVTDETSMVTKSICPKGWKLPNEKIEVEKDTSIASLYTAYGGHFSVIAGDPLHFVQSGYVHVGPGYEIGVVSLLGVNGYYVNGSLKNEVSSGLRQSISIVNRYNLDTDYLLAVEAGGTVRCVAR